jgi:hypothetical protein
MKAAMNRLVCLFSAVTLLAVGCGGSSGEDDPGSSHDPASEATGEEPAVLPTISLEDDISAEILNQDRDYADVVCPEDVEWVVGSSFYCKVKPIAPGTYEGFEPYRIDVKISKEAANAFAPSAGEYSWARVD